MPQSQIPSPLRHNTRARVALGFSDPISVEIPEDSLDLPWRDVVQRALADSGDPEAVRLREVLATQSEFQFESGGNYLAGDSSTSSVLGREGEGQSEKQDQEAVVRLMRRQRGGLGG